MDTEEIEIQFQHTGSNHKVKYKSKSETRQGKLFCIINPYNFRINK